jgi:hypothetical protein
VSKVYTPVTLLLSMKIKVEEGLDKPFLENGRHPVEISEVTEGKSEKKGVPFFSCRFENENGFITSRYYYSEPGMPTIVDLFKTVGIEVKEGDQLDTADLVGKKLSILVTDRTYTDSNGKEKTIKQAVDFKKSEEAERSNASK